MNSTNSTGMSPGLCTTPACVHIASEILYNLAPNYTDIDPCTNFDQYACNGWVERSNIPDGRSTLDVLSSMQEDIHGAVRKILEGPYPNVTDNWISVNFTQDQMAADMENFKKLQTAYATCLNYTEVASEGIEPLMEFVKTVAEAFPANPGMNSSATGMNKTYDHSAAFAKTITLFESMGIETTQTFAVRQDDEDPDKSILTILPGSTTDIPTDPKAISAYLEISAALLAAVHPANITIAQAGALMLSSIELQGKVAKSLAAIAGDLAGQSNTTTTGSESLNPPKTSIDEIQALAPQLNYKAVIEALAPQGYNASRILFPLAAAPYYGNLSQIAAVTPPEAIQTFFIWRAIATLAPHIDSPLTDAYNDFITLQAGENPDDGRPRWKQCVRLLDLGVPWIQASQILSNTVGPSGLTWMVSRFFVEQNYSPEARDLSQELLDVLEETFIERMQNNTWASNSTKALAVEKAKQIRNKIALPTSPNATDPIALGSYYSDVAVNGSYLETVLSLATHSIGSRWKTLGKPFDRNEFKFSTLVPNAYYNPPLNEIVMLAGIQQFPLFDVDFPTYLTYGGMGAITGHEIVHGFDNQGRLYDAKGNLTIWWDNATIASFTERTKCFVQQYSNYTILAPNGTAVPVNGALTLNENIADAGGIVGSFAAWKKLEAKKGKAQSLPGLDAFTHEQLFFVKWGQTWCADIAPATKVKLLSSDVHAPNSARISVALQNSAEFKRAFNCPVKEATCELY